MPNIALDHPGRPYRPGDVITGVIANAGPGPFRHASVSLEGRAKVKIVRHRGQNRTRHVYRSRVLLCSQQQNVLLDEHGNLRFEIPLPAKAFDMTGVQYRTDYFDNQWERHGLFAGSDIHDLPPTMSGSCNTLLGNNPGQMYIEYRLTAHVTPENRPAAVLNSSPCTFWVASASPSEEELIPFQKPAVMKFFTGFKTLKLFPDYGERALTFRETLKNTFSSKVPELTFNTEISTPRFIYSGEPMKIELSVAVPRSNGIGPAEADISIRTLSVEFKRSVGCRAKTFWSTTDMSDSETVLEERVIEPKNPKRFGPSQGGFSQVKTVLSRPIRLAPSFETCNVHRSYRVTIKASLACAGEMHSISQVAAIKVFSRPTGLPSYGAVMNGTEEVEELIEDWGPCPKFRDDD